MFPLGAIIMISFRLNFHQSLSDFKKKKIIYYLWYRTTAMTYETWVIYQAYGVGLGGENCLDLLHIYIYIFVRVCVCMILERRGNLTRVYVFIYRLDNHDQLDFYQTLCETHIHIYIQKKNLVIKSIESMTCVRFYSLITRTS